MIGPFGGSGIRPNACLGEWIGEYVDAALSPAEQLCADRHLVACQGCRAEVELERRLRSTLRAEPRMPDALRSTLMSLSQEIPIQSPQPRPARAPRPPAVPAAPVPVPDWAFAGPQVRVLAPDAPAQHRSARRSAAFAGAAAGVSIVAVWAFSAAPAATARPGAPAAVIPSRPAPSPASAPESRTGPRTATLVVRTGAQTGILGAQSTP